MTQADTMDLLREALRDGVSCHFDATHRLKLVCIHYVRDEVIAA